MEQDRLAPNPKYIPFADRYSLEERKAKFEKQIAEYLRYDAGNPTSCHSSSRNTPSPNCRSSRNQGIHSPRLRFVCERANLLLVTFKLIESKVQKAMEENSIKKDGKNSFYLYINKLIPNMGRYLVIQSRRWGSSTISTSLRTGFCTSSTRRWRPPEESEVFLPPTEADFAIVLTG